MRIQFTFLSHLLKCKARRQLHLLAGSSRLGYFFRDYIMQQEYIYVYIYIHSVYISYYFCLFLLTLSFLFLSQMANLSNCPTIWRACQERTVSHRSDIAGIQMRSVKAAGRRGTTWSIVYCCVYILSSLSTPVSLDLHLIAHKNVENESGENIRDGRETAIYGRCQTRRLLHLTGG